MVSGKVVLISGGARGLGAAHARRLVDEGARVVLGDVLDERGEALAAELGIAARYVHLDVTEPADWDAAVAVALAEFGRLDVLVNNAGVAVAAPVDQITASDWHHVVDVNLNGVFYGIQAVIPAMKQAGGGSIINISSTAGLKGYPDLAVYTATKWAVRGLTKSVALDLGRYAIRVNSVHPGFIRTPMTDGLSRSRRHVAVPRPGEPEEVAELIVFLASDASSFSTGAEFVVDGGESAGVIARS